eukprot:TRINITY_DN5377_c0_g1_i1.p1 TRINITY_DN5377_c0_g1~~TRINITY_DN5377_c0_g1_i1.p1  ORF type:complete len:241 (+),score=77.85 TRINITY_DN5377_c0_g1_i1:740-1462(+)
MASLWERLIKTKRKQDKIDGTVDISRYWNDDKRELVNAWRAGNNLRLYSDSTMTKQVLLKAAALQVDKPYYTRNGNKLIKLGENHVTLESVELNIPTSKDTLTPVRRRQSANPIDQSHSGWRLTALEAIDAILVGFKESLKLEKGIPFKIPQGWKLVKSIDDFDDGILHECTVAGLELQCKRNHSIVFVNGRDFPIKLLDPNEEIPRLVLQWVRRDGTVIRETDPATGLDLCSDGTNRHG